MLDIIIINILGDAPPRGFCGKVGQKFGYKTCTAIRAYDKAGPQAPDLFEKINEKCMKYNVLQTDNFQDAMVTGFTEIAKDRGGEERFQVYDMKNNLNFSEVSNSIIDSIKHQLKKTNEYLNNPNAPRNRCIAV